MSKILGKNKLSDFQDARLSEYNDTNIQSIVSHSHKLKDKSIALLYKSQIKKARDGDGLNQNNKGLLGQLVELYHFGYKPNSDKGPDFPHAGKNGLELKTTGALNRSKSKEPLRITKINLETSRIEDFIHKSQLLLIMVYDYQDDTDWEDMIFFKFKLFDMSKDIPKSDYMTIKDDWKNIMQLMRAGNIKNLRNKTVYLEAKTQGQKKTSERSFYFKQTFLDTILFPNENLERIVKDKELEQTPLLEVIKKRISKYFGRTKDSLEQEFEVNASKQGGRIIINRILGLSEKKESLEIKQANIQIKTVTVGGPKQHMSFKQIKYDQIVKEKHWEDSEIYEQVTAKFMFVIYKYDKEKNQYLDNIVFYSLSDDELDECKKVWVHTKNKILNNDYKNFILYETSRPKDKDRDRNKFAHIRTKDAINKKTGKYAPVNTPQGIRDDINRCCFWFNRNFVDSIINNH